MTSIDKRQAKQKAQVIEMLKKTPIIQIVCDKTGVSRATYYRWKKEDATFAKQAEEALDDGAKLVSDLAESQLISAIRSGNLTAIIFWLKYHHPAYANTVEITGRLMHDYQLTPAQEALITKALKMVSKKSEKEKQ